MTLPARDDSSLPFRIWSPDQQPAAGDGPSLSWTLREFYEQWFLLQRDKRASAGTKAIRGNLLDWWERLTKNPPLWAIDDETIEAFAAALTTATFARSKLPTAKRYPLSVFNQRKLLSNLRTLLNAIGPQRTKKLKTVHLISDPPLVELPPDDAGEPKQPIPLKIARKMFSFCDRLTWPRPTKRTPAPPPFACGDYFRAWLYALYVLGFRESTIDLLTWSMVSYRRGHWWIRVPKECVEKTSKGRWKFLHPAAYEALDKIRSSDPRLLPLPYSKSWRDARHAELQQLAGVPAEDRLSVQAWRRTHANAVEYVGRRKLAQKLAQWALDHSDGSITRQFYLENEHKVLRRLPRLARRKKAQPDATQLTLF